MENPFSKVAKAVKESDFVLRSQTKKETKAEVTFTDEEMVDEIIKNKDFAKFLVDSNPKYQSMRFDKKDFKEIREKYYAFTESNKVADDLENLYSREIMEDLGIDLKPAEKDRVFGEMHNALREKLQRDNKNIEISRLKNKLEEYAKLKEKLDDLESKFQAAGVSEAVSEGVKSEQGMKQLKDREQVAKTAKKIKIPFMNGRNRGIQEAIQDLNGNFEVEKDSLKQQFAEVKAGRKEAEELKGQMDELRQYFLAQVKIADSLIQAARREANNVLKDKNATVKTEAGKFKQADADEMRRLSDLKAYSDLSKASNRSSSEVQYMRDLDLKHNFLGKDFTPADQARLEVLTQAEEERSGKLLEAADSERGLLSKMREGQKKKGRGGVDYTVDGKVPDFLDPSDWKDDSELVKSLDGILERELENTMQRAVFTSRSIEQFEHAVDPVLKRWEAGKYTNRPKVRDFISNTLVKLANEFSIEPVLKVQIKAVLFKRGIFKGLTGINIPK